jgi:DNA-binding NarL/FixJ family response regulator
LISGISKPKIRVSLIDFLFLSCHMKMDLSYSPGRIPTCPEVKVKSTQHPFPLVAEKKRSQGKAAEVSIRILLADDHQIMRDGLRSLFENHPEMAMVAEAENGRQAFKLARKLKPDVIILDINMPDLNGIDATGQIMSDCPAAKVIGLSMYSDKQFVVGMLKAGASGYLLKDCAFDELTIAVQTVAANQTYLSPSIAGTVIKDYLEQLSANSASSQPVLTAREREVVQLYAEGRTTRQIAESLNISREPQHQRQDRRNPPPQDHAKTRYPQHRRAHQVCHPPGTDLPGFLIKFQQIIRDK